MPRQLITVTVNGKKVEKAVEPRTLLIHFLREELNLTGAHIGCETSHCGACTVDIDGKSVKSCTVLAVQCDGADVITVEGLANRRRAARGAGRLLRGARPAMRLLHPGHADARLPLAAREPQPHRRRDPRRACPATCAAAPATRTSSRPCNPQRRNCSNKPSSRRCLNIQSGDHQRSL